MEMMQLDTMMIGLNSTSDTLMSVLRCEAKKLRETQPDNVAQSNRMGLIMMLAKILNKDTLRATQIVMKIIEQCVGSKSIYIVITDCQLFRPPLPF